MKKLRIFLVVLVVLGAIFTFSSCRGEVYETVPEDDVSREEISDLFFTTNGYSKKLRGPEMSGEDFSVFNEYIIDVRAECPIALDSVVLNVVLYDEENNSIGRYRVSRSEDVDAKTEFSIEVAVEKEEYESMHYIIPEYSGISNGKLYGFTDFKFNVTYVYGNGQDVKFETVDWKSSLSMPDVPQKNGYVFNGWYTDPEFTQWFSFEDNVITEDTVLYAHYDINYIDMARIIMDLSFDSVVKITAKSYTTLLWGAIEMSSSVNEGEGVIVADSSGYYYVLTSNDLVEKAEGYEFIAYTVEDMYGNVYEAKLKHNSAAYGLGMLYFETGTELKTVDIAKKNAAVGEKIAVTHLENDGRRYTDFGNVTEYKEIHHKDYYVERKDINHEMMMYNTSDKENVSGKAVFDFDMNIVGIQCGSYNHDGTVLNEAHAVPVHIIRRYIEAYGI